MSKSISGKMLQPKSGYTFLECLNIIQNIDRIILKKGTILFFRHYLTSGGTIYISPSIAFPQ